MSADRHGDVALGGDPPPTLLGRLSPPPPDPLMITAQAVRADPRPDKLDLGVGVYKDAEGRTPIMPAISLAERRRAERAEGKAYLPPGGRAAFVAELRTHAFGSGRSLAGVQAPGGAGALRLALELVRCAQPQATVWCADATWPGHAGLVAATGLRLRSFRHRTPGAPVADVEAALDALREAKAGDVIILQACCHNPTGLDLPADAWAAIAHSASAQGVTPLVDVAYQGLGRGPEADMAGVRALLDRTPEALVAVTCSKAFGLYRERTGALYAHSLAEADRVRAVAQLEGLARTLWSSPPDHGAALVLEVLSDPALRADWLATVEGMRQRIAGLRSDLERRLAGGPFAVPPGGHGLFVELPFTPGQLALLRDRHAIHVPATGRVSLPGLGPDAARFAQALQDVALAAA